MNKFKVFILIYFSFCLTSFGQLQSDICEHTVPVNWKAVEGRLTMSDQYFKNGKQSVRWDWNSTKSIISMNDKALESVVNDPRSTLVFWLYNPKNIDDQLEFVFYKGQNEVYKFNFKLNFKGWRTAWVMYHRDMLKLANGQIDRMEIKSPHSVKNGTLYFDQILYNVTINPRSPMRDLQVPFVNLEGDKAANAHWNSLYKFNANPGFIAFAKGITEKSKKQFNQIEKRYVKLITAKKIESIDSLKKDFAFWNIRRSEQTLTGQMIYSTNDIELTGESLLAKAKEANERANIKRYSQLMLSLACLHRQTDDSSIKHETERMYIDLLDFMDEQGWSYGSGMGALHHLGYNLADYYSSCLLMKEPIRSNGKLDRTFKTMYWFSGLGRTLETAENLPVSNIDVFNTLLGSMLSTVLFLDDGVEKLRYLQHFSHWMSHNVKPNLEITGAFKPDGAVFHHGTLYPAYGTGGYNGLAPIIYVLSHTQFQIDAEAHQQFKDNMLMMHYYTNPTRWPISVSGRHPTGNWRIPDIPYAYMALSGSPDGKEEIDKQMAAVYLLINKSPKSPFAKRFQEMGIAPAVYPDMHWTLNYGLLDIHRRNNWLMTIKGHNRYIVSHEAYPNANVFGRYSSYGQLEVLYPEQQNDISSNFMDKGWDWNRIPGTTTLHVPLDILRADIKNVDDYSGVEEMLLTDELFAGGVHLQKQGVFAMKLKGHDKYDMGNFKATKSWFSFDSLVVALGSDISNPSTKYPTETILFQNFLNDKSDDIYIDADRVHTFPYKNTKPLSMVVDNRKIGYYIPNGQHTVAYKQEQISRDQKDLKDTHGNFAGLYINHGYTPHEQSYEYAMLIETDSKKMDDFVAKMKSSEPLYTVLRKDSLVHSVLYHPQNMTGLAIFKSNIELNDPYILYNSRPCLLMYKDATSQLDLSLVDPDLAFYEGPDDAPRNVDGTRKEASIYSRSWFKTPSRPTVLQITLKGKWSLTEKEKNSCKSEYNKDGNTVLTFHCKYGLTTNISLTRD